MKPLSESHITLEGKDVALFIDFLSRSHPNDVQVTANVGARLNSAGGEALSIDVRRIIDGKTSSNNHTIELRSDGTWAVVTRIIF
jgi:hypothetical protein